MLEMEYSNLGGGVGGDGGVSTMPADALAS